MEKIWRERKTMAKHGLAKNYLAKYKRTPRVNSIDKNNQASTVNIPTISRQRAAG